MSEVTLAAGAKTTIHFSHKYVRLVRATGVLHVATAGSKLAGFDVGAGEIISFNEAVSVVVTNKLDIANTFEFRDSPVPVGNTSGMSVDVNSLPPMEIAPDQTVAVGTVDFPVGANLAVNNFPSNQDVTVTGVPAVTVNALPNVTVGALPNVTVDALPDVNVDTSGRADGLPSHSFPVDKAYTIPANPARKRLEIVASLGNVGKIWVGSHAANVGIPLGKGESYNEELNADTKLYADNLNDVVYLLEKVKV